MATPMYLQLQFISRSTPIEVGTKLTNFEIAYKNKTRKGPFVTYVTAEVPDGKEYLLLFEANSNLMSYVKYLNSRQPGGVIDEAATISSANLGKSTIRERAGEESGKRPRSTSRTVADIIATFT